MKQLPSIPTLWDRYRVWVIVALLLAVAFAVLHVRSCNRKKQEEKEQYRIDSNKVEAKALDSKEAIYKHQNDSLSSVIKSLQEAQKQTATQRKTETHAYSKNVAAVRAMPDDEQVKFSAEWLAAEGANR